jgi:endonuclease YncB( thermonuclease family)
MDRAQIYKGWAPVYVYDKPFKRISAYRSAESSAKAAHRGIWGIC